MVVRNVSKVPNIYRRVRLNFLRNLVLSSTTSFLKVGLSNLDAQEFELRNCRIINEILYEPIGKSVKFYSVK